MLNASLSRLPRYGVAILTPALAWLITLALYPWIGRNPSVLFLAAVMVSTWYGGLRPGLLTTGLATLAIAQFFFVPAYALATVSWAEVLRLGVFIGVALLINFLGAAHAREKERLRLKEAPYRSIYENTTVGLALGELGGRILQSNAAMQQILGFNGVELRRWFSSEFTYPNDGAEEWDFYRELLAGQRDHYHLQRRFIRKDGQPVWVYLTISLLRDTEGNPQFAIIIGEDIMHCQAAA